MNRFKSLSLRRLARLLLGCLLIYAASCVGCASFQRKFIYYPRQRSSAQVDTAAAELGLQRWTNSSGQAIGMKRLSPRQPPEGQVLVFYGNANWSGGCAHYADVIQAVAAFDVFILEYPGYADRSGSPGEKNNVRAANEALQLLPTNRPVYLVGESLGTGVASSIAGAHPERIAGLVLLSPYDCLAGVAQYHMPLLPVSLMLVDRYPSADHLQNYHGPVGIMVDGRDTVVPEKFGLRLYAAYHGPKRLWQFPEGQHISIMEPPAKFWGEVFEFWQTNPPADFR